MIAKPHNHLTTKDKTHLGLLLLFLIFDIFSGPLRYYLSQIGLLSFIYLPKALIAIATASSLVLILRRGIVSTAFITACICCFFFAIVGLIYTNRITQVAFGVFVFIPLIYAVLIEPAIRKAGSRVSSYIFLLWLAVATGIWADYQWDLPWTGFTYELGDLDISGSREWTTFGLERIAGFARASFEAADQLLLFGLCLTFLSRKSIVTIGVWILTGALIYATTTKKTFAAYLFLTFLLAIVSLPIAPTKAKQALIRIVPPVIATIGILLPISVYFINYKLSLNSYWTELLLTSFEDRLTYVWPTSLSLAFDHGSPILGRGIGGIGAAQNYFEPALFMPADNLFIYLYVTFGIFSLAIVIAFLKNLSKIEAENSRWDTMIWFLSVSILFSGWASNGIESSIVSITLGVIAANAYSRRKLRPAQ